MQKTVVHMEICRWSLAVLLINTNAKIGIWVWVTQPFGAEYYLCICIMTFVLVHKRGKMFWDSMFSWGEIRTHICINEYRCAMSDCKQIPDLAVFDGIKSANIWQINTASHEEGRTGSDTVQWWLRGEETKLLESSAMKCFIYCFHDVKHAWNVNARTCTTRKMKINSTLP